MRVRTPYTRIMKSKAGRSKLHHKLLAGFAGVCLSAGLAKAQSIGGPLGTVASQLEGGAFTIVDEQYFFPVLLNPGDTQTYNV